MQIKNKVAIVTGAAVRVGKATALSLAEKGAHVVVTYFDAEDPWQETLAEIHAMGVKGMALQMDVCQPEHIQKCIQQVVDSFGRIDILVNNASTWLSSPFERITLEEWNVELAVNLTGPFLCSQMVAPYMLRQKSGVIINITDLSAFQTWPNYAHHSASKAGLVALTRVMAAELAPHVRVNVVAPGTVLLQDNADDKKRLWAIENSLLKRIGRPEDVAETVIFLINSDFVTGAVYFVDGGRALV